MTTPAPTVAERTDVDLVGRGALSPRARFDTDAAQLLLDGLWQVRFSSSIASAPADLDDPDLDIAGWRSIPVPSSWPMQGEGRPQYTNKVYPFPVDPPFVPDENTIGDHAVRFSWPGGDGAVLRLDGVDAAGEIHLNGVFVGTTRGSRLVHEFDVSDAVRTGENLLVVRVTQWAATSYLEDQDMWWLPGLFRSVTVTERRRGGIRDVQVDAFWEGGIGTLRVDADADGPVRIAVPELGVEAEPGAPLEIPHVEPWTAEAPRLYDLVVSTDTETARLRIGFRSIRIDGVRFLVNDNPILLRGVNRHEHHPDLGRVVPRDVVERELRLMKQHNINAIRTSHYPPHPDLPALADELGFWLIVECDFETHGFEFVGWRGNPTDDPAYRDALVDRMARTVARDRNHPSVVLWSLGNEADPGVNLAAMAETARALDPHRPLHYEGDRSSRHVDVYSRMYAHPEEVARIARGQEAPLPDPAEDARRRGMPFVLCEYAHAMGNGPGGLREYQALFESSDRMLGGFIWEWLEHGIRRHTPDGRPFFAYGGDFGEAVHDGNFVADGLVDADRNPRPGLADVAVVFAPVRFEFEGDRLRVVNRYDTIGLRGLTGHWQHESADGTVRTGRFELPDPPPRRSAVIDLPADMPPHGVVTVSAVLASDAAWAEAGHEVAWAQRGAFAAPAAPGGSEVPAQRDGAWELGAATIDANTGLLTLAGLDLEGPRLVLWRAPTDNDLGVQHLAPEPDAEPLHAVEGIPDATAWESAGLPALQTRVVSVHADPGAVTVTARVAPAVFGWGALLRLRYTSVGESLTIDVSVDPVGEWPCPWARVGLVLRLPTVAGATWRGLGPGPAYPDTGLGQRLGVWSADLDGLRTDFVRPQESGSRRRVTELEVALADASALHVGGDEFAFTVSPWTAEQLAAAAHPTDLPASDAAWLTIDLAQHGIGSGACGPGVLGPYRLDPRPVTGRLSLRVVPPPA